MDQDVNSDFYIPLADICSDKMFLSQKVYLRQILLYSSVNVAYTCGGFKRMEKQNFHLLYILFAET